MLKRYREAYCSNIVRPGEKGKSFRQIYGNKAEELEPNEEESKYINFAKQYFRESDSSRSHATKEKKLIETIQGMVIDYTADYKTNNIARLEELENFAKDEREYYFSSLDKLSDYDFDSRIIDLIEEARREGYICNCGNQWWFDAGICKTPRVINDDDDE